MADSVAPRGSHEGGTRRDFLIWRPAPWPPSASPALVWPLIDQMNPSADVLALSSIEVDIAKVEVGQRIKVMWRGHPVFVDHRTPEEIKEAEDVNVAELRDPQTDAQRVQKTGMADRRRRLHPSRLHSARHGADRSARRVRRLVLPLPRLAIRHLGPHPPRARRRSISRCRPTSFSPPPRFASARTALMTASATRPGFKNPIIRWIDHRLPIFSYHAITS